MKKVTLIRHGEAGDDRLNQVRYQPKNQYDKPLTMAGVEQAKKLSTVFENREFDRSFTSDYLRAIETHKHAGIHSRNHLELTEIRELYCECIGMNFGNTELAEFKQQKIRVQRFIEEHLLATDDSEQLVVVAHGCLILYLLKVLTGKSFGHHVTHTGITELTYDGQWDFASFNNAAHLYEPVDRDIEALFR